MRKRHVMRRAHALGVWWLLSVGLALGLPQIGHADARTLLAAPLDNDTGQEKYAPAAEGLTQLIAAMIAREGSITVVDRESLHLVKAEQKKALAGLSLENAALKAGQLLKADTVLAGRLFLKEGALTIGVKAIDLKTERALAVGEASCTGDDLPTASLALAKRLAQQMALPEPVIDLKQLDANPVASLHFAEGLSRYYAGHLDEAIVHFLRTLDLDPDFVEAHDYCGRCYQQQDEPGHALIEWKALLKRRPDYRDAEKIRAAIARAQGKSS